MADGFGERIDPTAAISAILGTYPFSVGLLREILQNSDDAKASKQTFILDHRTHSRNHLSHEELGDAQGPALLAYNDAIFADEDWTALQLIHQSSKKIDTSKIGKYGVGFRSSYHITDTPQILSATSLAILDPHHSFSDSGGSKHNITRDTGRYMDHFSAFNIDIVAPTYSKGTAFPGTVIRLPFRVDASRSRISPKVVSAAEIKTLLSDFVREEIAIAMLFLSNISTIEIFEVDERGSRLLGKAQIRRDRPLTLSLECRVTSAYVTVNTDGKPSNADWTVLHAVYSLEECAQVLTDRLGYNASVLLSKEKLSPSVSLAIPATVPQQYNGRLFTFLPLPLPTGFPIHIHSLFALTQARQNLRNGSERGMVKGTTDEMLPEWNRVLFDIYIPRAWGSLLEYLSRHVDAPDTIFNACPPQAQDASGGDPAYWNDIPLKLLRVIMEHDTAIWPVVPGASNISKFASSSSVLFASEDSLPYLSALSNAGISVTLPPEYIRSMLPETGYQFSWLTPESARNKLTSEFADVKRLSDSAKAMLLEFLLSGDSVFPIVEIPIIPLSGGSYTALRARNSAVQCHVLLGEEDADVFRRFDDRAIVISSLPKPARNIFISKAHKTLNVSPLGCDDVVEYLLRSTAHFGLSTAASFTEETRRWITSFWLWLSAWPERDTLLLRISSFKLVPTSMAYMQNVEEAVFDSASVDEAIEIVLSKTNLTFLDKTFPPAALPLLDRKHTLKAANDLSAVLEYLHPDKVATLPLSEWPLLVRHLLYCTRRSGKALDYHHRHLLRSLAIFPVMRRTSAFEDGFREYQIQSLPCNATIICVDPATMHLLGRDAQKVFLPAITTHVFVAYSLDGVIVQPLLDQLSAVGATSMKSSELDIVRLFIEHITDQPKLAIATFLRLLVRNRSSIPPRLFNDLRSVAFVATQGNPSSMKPPKLVIDPRSDLTKLFDADDPYLPSMVNIVDQQILQHLSELQLLRQTLEADIVEERLNHISGGSPPNPTVLAVELIRLLNADTAFKYNRATSGFGMCWLPTESGLKSPDETRDDHRNHDRALFDRVWFILKADAITSPSLRMALGWNRRIPLEILKQQLSRELEAPQEFNLISTTCSRLETILRELGRRVEDIRETPMMTQLMSVTACKSWIPVGRSKLCPLSRVVLDIQKIPHGFYSIPPALLGCAGVEDLLLLMGCSRSPNASAIVEELRMLKVGGTAEPVRDIEPAIDLLRAVSHASLDDSQRDQLLAPDVEHRLRPLKELYYNDVPDRAHRLQLPSDRVKCHARITEGLASRLGVQSLSSLNLKEVDIDMDEEDMHEDLTKRISNVLKQYSVEQTFNEFLANAADAGAREYNILLDLKVARYENVLCTSMKELQQRPALVLHNNAIFQEQDFKGIRTIGTGGKEQRSNTIGRFGLGALSAFHFTEVLMIVSGEYVMFLDPSERYLPRDGYRRRRALRLTLSQMWMLYRDHLSALVDLFQFQRDCEFYDGTLFRLPLRSSRQISLTRSALSHELLSHDRVQDLITAYWKSAPESLLFILVNSIAAWKRDGDGNVSQSWRTNATRSFSTWEEETDITCSCVTVDSCQQGRQASISQWHVVSKETSIDALPSKFQSFVSKHQIRRVSLAVAGCIIHGQGKPQKGNAQFRLYSKLPLPTLTSLPVHVDASWILAEDRRTIRFDESGQTNLESQYNVWLLSDCLPDVYGVFLVTWPKAQNEVMWPGNITRTEDPISKVFTEAFYTQYAPASPTPMCVTITERKIRVDEAIFLGIGSSAIRKYVDILKPEEVVKLPSRVLSRFPLPGNLIRRIDAQFIGDVIPRNERFQDAFHNGSISIDDVNVLLEWMLNEASSTLLGLRVLPLADNSLGTIHRRGEGPLFFGVSEPLHPPWPLFPANRFVHPRIYASDLYDKDLNISGFSSVHVVNLLQETIPKADRRQLTELDVSWVHTFWMMFDKLDVETGDISSYPLIETTTQDNLFVSLSYCQSDHVFMSPAGSDTTWLSAILEMLGVMFVADNGHLPSTVQTQLSSTAYTFNHLLKYLRSLGVGNLQNLFETRVSQEYLSLFSPYVRNKLSSLRTVGEGKKKTIVTVDYPDVVRALPICPATKEGSHNLLSYVAAHDANLRMLPSSLSLKYARPYLDVGFSYVDYYRDFEEVLNMTPLTYSALIDTHLRFPDTIADEDIPTFRAFLLTMLGYAPSKAPFMIPNHTGEFVYPSTLYAYSIPIFRTALACHPKYFLHPLLRSDATDKLAQFGLHKEVDFSAFKLCAETIQDDHELDSTDSTARAAVVYQYYSDQLWSVIGDDMDRWQQLDTIRFIPRSEVSRNIPAVSFIPSQWAPKSLSSIVSPSQLVRPEFEAIAWTQRALFLVPPSQRLLLANISLGIPTGTEVVEHLCTLVNIARDHALNSCLSLDIAETYRWLQGHLEDSKAALLSYKHLTIFLNIDGLDPAAALEWTFVPILVQFRDLVLAAGAQEVKNAVLPELKLSPAEQILKRMRNKFDDHRHSGLFCDVILRSSDEREYLVHQIILAAATSHFETQFSGPWSEAQGVVKIVNVESNSDTLEKVIEYIYTGSLGATVEDQDDLLELLELSDRWEIPDLFAIVENRLITTITLDTYKELSKVGGRYNAMSLVGTCEDFKRNNAHILNPVAL